MMFFLLFLFSFACSQPSWLRSIEPPAAPQVHPAVAAAPSSSTSFAPVPRAVKPKIVYDTVYIAKVDTVFKVDTLLPPSPVYYNYTVYYEILDKRISAGDAFEWAFEKTAQKTVLQGSDTTFLSLGTESLRTLGYTYDNYGNKTETVERVIEGLDMRISGLSVNITYRVGSSLLTLGGKFDSFGLLQLTSDFARRRYFLYFIPLDFLFSSQKLTLLLRVEKLEVFSNG